MVDIVFLSRKMSTKPDQSHRAAILAYVDAHNARDAPFKWVKIADEILDSMRRFGLRIQQVHSQ
jgi:hypothetical protein